jgi:flagellar motor switch protein FliN/FliY
MAEDNLSQEEIDALMKSSQNEEGGESGEGREVSEKGGEDEADGLPEAGGPEVESVLTSEQLDALGEFYNIAMGKAATVLSTLLGKQVEITTPVVTLETWEGIRKKHPVPSLVVAIKYTEGLQGNNVLVINRRDANILANVMDEADVDVENPLDEYRQGIVGEAMNQMVGGAVVSISEMLGREVVISPPSIYELDLREDAAALKNPFGVDQLVQIAFRFDVEDLIQSEMLQVMPADFARGLADEILEEEEKASQEGGEGETDGDSGGEEGPEEEKAEPPVQVKKAEFQPLDKGNGGLADGDNLQLIMDIEIEVAVELGRTHMKIKDVLALGEGSVIELDKLVGEPMEIYANDKLIARGEVVVIDEDFGVRITEIVKSGNLQKSLN